MSPLFPFPVSGLQCPCPRPRPRPRPSAAHTTTIDLSIWAYTSAWPVLASAHPHPHPHPLPIPRVSRPATRTSCSLPSLPCCACAFTLDNTAFPAPKLFFPRLRHTPPCTSCHCHLSSLYLPRLPRTRAPPPTSTQSIHPNTLFLAQAATVCVCVRCVCVSVCVPCVSGAAASSLFGNRRSRHKQRHGKRRPGNYPTLDHKDSPKSTSTFATVEISDDDDDYNGCTRPLRPVETRRPRPSPLLNSLRIQVATQSPRPPCADTCAYDDTFRSLIILTVHLRLLLQSPILGRGSSQPVVE